MNSYYNRTRFLQPNTLAESNHLNAEHLLIQQGFDKLPAPHPTLPGFGAAVAVGTALLPDHAVNLGQLGTILDDYATEAAVAAAFAAHLADLDPHPQYLTPAEGSALFSALGHNHDALYSPLGHNHDGAYSALGHTHVAGNVTDFSEAVDDRVAALLQAGANIALSYDDVTGALTIAASGVLTSVVWGGITGTLSDQADLVAALGAKVDKAGDTMTGPLQVNAAAGVYALVAQGNANNFAGGVRAVNPHAGDSAYTLLSAGSDAGEAYVGALSAAAGGVALFEATMPTYVRTVGTKALMLGTNGTTRLTFDGTTGVGNFSTTPTVGGTAVSLVTHNHDGAYSAIGHIHSFASLSGIPTTIGGYGITDFNSLGDARWVQKSGDTMSGALVLDTGVATDAKLQLHIARGLVLRPTATTGGWARGTWVQKASDFSEIAGFGFAGSNETVDRFYVGFGSSPWSPSAMTVTSGGSIGLGAAPPTTGGGHKTINIGGAGDGVSGSAGVSYLAQNIYYDGASWRHGYAAAAAMAYINGGNFYLYGAPSAGAGAVAAIQQILAVSKGNTLTLEGGAYAGGTGIAFPATQNASANANTLDDYEEGDWSPVSGTANVAVSVVGGSRYTKVGRLVVAHTYVTVTNNTGAPLSAWNLAGLPFTASSAVYHGAHQYYDQGTNRLPMYTYVDPSSASITIGWASPLASGATVGFMYQAIYEAAS